MNYCANDKSLGMIGTTGYHRKDVEKTAVSGGNGRFKNQT